MSRKRAIRTGPLEGPSMDTYSRRARPGAAMTPLEIAGLALADKITAAA